MTLRFVVAQRGARHGYRIPSLLEGEGILERFFTDACGNVGWGQLIGAAERIVRSRSVLGRLANRRVPEEIRERTHAFLLPDLLQFARNTFSMGSASAAFRNSLRHSRELGICAVRKGFGRANALYVMLDEFGPLIVAARSAGHVVVSDVYIIPSSDQIVARELSHFPEWGEVAPEFTKIKAGEGLGDPLTSNIDHFICPSQAVVDDLVENWKVSPECTALVPYGVDVSWIGLPTEPQRGRILFAGSAEIRKGIHYLALAAMELGRRGRRYEFRVVGDASDAIRCHPMSRGLTFVGRVPRGEMRSEFSTADVLVLPSLAEGSATVTYEALAYGLPQVVTRASGSVARHGVDGLVIPERDPIAIADCIEEIVENRARREAMSLASRQRALEYTWDEYGRRLTGVLRELQR